MKIHTGDKPFDCTFPGCPKKYATNSMLINHMERVHKCDKNSLKKGKNGVVGHSVHSGRQTMHQTPVSSSNDNSLNSGLGASVNNDDNNALGDLLASLAGETVPNKKQQQKICYEHL